jgi:hypothetical protein
VNGCDPVLEIYVEKDAIGYRARGFTGPHTNGPRQAAEEAARQIFPDGFTLVTIGKNHYQARAA